MQLVKYFYGAALTALFSTSAFAHVEEFPEFQKKYPQIQRHNTKNLHNEMLIESFYRSFAPKEDLSGVFNMATGKPIVGKVYPKVITPLEEPHFDFTGTIDTLKVPEALLFMLTAIPNAPETLELDRQVDEKLKKYKGRQRDQEDQSKKAHLIKGISHEYDQLNRRLNAQGKQKYRAETQDLTTVFDKSFAYDVVHKRNPRALITQSLYYGGPEEIMPLEKRKRVLKSDEWIDTSDSQNQLKRKWALRSEVWDEKTPLHANKKRKLDH